MRITPGALAYFAGNALSAGFQLCTVRQTKRQLTVTCWSLGNVIIEPLFKSRLQFLVLVTEEDGFDLDRGKSNRYGG